MPQIIHLLTLTLVCTWYEESTPRALVGHVDGSAKTSDTSPPALVGTILTTASTVSTPTSTSTSITTNAKISIALLKEKHS